MRCKKCGIIFPIRIRIQDKIRHLGSRKYCLTCSPWGSRNRKRLEKDGDARGHYRVQDGGSLMCSACRETKPIKEFYRKGTWWMPYCKKCTKKKALKGHQLFKLAAIRYKGGACADCGCVPHPAAMCFHHLDPSAKEACISHLRSLTFSRAKAELDKCVLLCLNCHAVRHAGDNWPTLGENGLKIDIIP